MDAKTWKKMLFLLLLVLAPAMVRSPACAEIAYTITDLGVLPAGTYSYPYGLNNSGQVVGYSNNPSINAFIYSPGLGMTALSTSGGTAYDINDAGQAVGYVKNASNQSRAFLYDATGLHDLGTLGGTISIAKKVNSLGQVAGYSRYDAGSNAYHAFLYSSSTGMVDIGSLGGNSMDILGLTNTGLVAGYGYLTGSTTVTHGFLYTPGTGLQDLGTLGGLNSRVTGMNELGQIVGYSEFSDTADYHAFLYENGGMIDLGTLGGVRSWASGINSSGQIAGYSQIAGSSSYHAFLYTSEDGIIDLGTLGGAWSYARGIAEDGTVYGYSQTSDSVSHAFIYRDGGMIDLNDLLPEDSDWGVLSDVTGSGINDIGQIIGIGTIEGQTHAFLMAPAAETPVPIPPAFLLFGSALAGLGFIRKKVWR